MTGVTFDIYSTAYGIGAVIAAEQGVIEVLLPFGGKTAANILAEILLRYPGAVRGMGRFAVVLQELKAYFAGERVRFATPVDSSRSTPFQQKVYGVVANIEYGSVCSYRDLAAATGSPRAARGIGTAMASNPIPVIIPCHRVVAADGRLTGYSAAGGIVTKELLLRMEGVKFSPSGRVIFS